MSDTVVPVAWKTDNPHCPLTGVQPNDAFELRFNVTPLYSEATVTALQSRIAELEKDAARYRWLRSEDTYAKCLWNEVDIDVNDDNEHYVYLKDMRSLEDLDSAIDAAIEAGK